MLSPNQIKAIKQTLKKVNATYIGVFGSYARGENTHLSDLDLIFDYDKPVSLLEIIGIEQELTEKLGIKVDLISKKSVNKYLESEILKDLIILS